MSLKSKIVLALLLGCLPVHLLSGQNPAIKSLNSRYLLSSNSINDIFQDERGFVWICTDDEIARIDPCTFSPVVASPSKKIFSDNNLYTSSYFDGRVVWIGTKRGLFRYDLENQTVDMIESENTGEEIRAIIPNRSGGIIMATKTQIFHYNNNMIRKISGMDFKFIVSISTDSDGEIFVCSDNDLYKSLITGLKYFIFAFI